VETNTFYFLAFLFSTDGLGHRRLYSPEIG